MSTPKIPPIDPDDLSPQADPERVARIWARLEPEVSAMAGRRARGGGMSDRLRRPFASRAGTMWLGAAAVAASLAGGIVIGRGSSSRTSSDEIALPSAATTDATLEIFASGSKTRTFALPNGGSLTLDPESTVEVAELSDATIVLRLLRGTASVDGTHVQGSVSIVAGEARMTTLAGGSMAVRRNAKDVDVTAMGRNVEIDSPAGHQTIASGQRAHAVPTHTTTARVATPAPRTPSSSELAPTPHPEDSSHGTLALARDPEATDPVEPPAIDPPPVESNADWLAKYQSNDWRGAYKLLSESGGPAATVDRARTPDELAVLCDIMRLAGKGDLAIKAAKRIVDEFPGDPQASVFAFTLANMYEQAGQTELASQYRERARASKGPLQEEAVCRQLREGSASDPVAAAVVDLARQYVSKYASSSAQCMELAEGILSDAPPAPAKPADSSEPAPSAAPSSSPAGSSPAGAPSAPANAPSAQPAPSAN